MIAKKFNTSISIIRVLAMLSIIAGHWLTMKGVNHYQLGQVGVWIFLFISGWLQSGKIIKDGRIWLFEKWKRIIVPFYVAFGICLFLRLLFKFEISRAAVFTTLLNLQGAKNIFGMINLSTVPGYGHTWFVTVIAACYILTLILKYFSKIEVFVVNNRKTIFFITVFAQILMSFFHIQIAHFICYFLGYFWDHDKVCSRKEYIWLTMFLFICTVARFVANKLFDGSILYDAIVFSWAFIALGVWLTITMMLLCKKYEHISKYIALSKAWMLLDLASYPLFLSHYMYVRNELSVENLCTNGYEQILLFVLFTCLTSLIVLLFSEFDKVKKIFVQGRF